VKRRFCHLLGHGSYRSVVSQLPKPARKEGRRLPKGPWRFGETRSPIAAKGDFAPPFVVAVWIICRELQREQAKD
jgi:hypothetical protein